MKNQKKNTTTILHAILVAAKSNCNVEPKFLNLRINEKDIKEIPKKVFVSTFNTILLSKQPSIYINLMRKLSMLKVFIPELNDCYKVTQNHKYHKYDVFTHCTHTCDNVDPDLILRLSALLHDIGKVDARKEEIDGNITFYKHEYKSAEKAFKILVRLKYPAYIAKSVSKLVSLHMYHYTREFTDSAVRRMIKRLNITKKDIDDNFKTYKLFKLRQADRLGNGFKTNPITQRQIDAEQRIVEVFKQDSNITTKDLNIDGIDLIKEFSIEEGKFVGDILNYLVNQIILDPTINNKKTLTYLASKFINNLHKYKN